MQDPKENQRTNKPYENYEVFHPNGTLMFRCGKKKINWYLSRNLATKLSEKSIKLNFEPQGYGDDPISLEISRNNFCAECGERDISKLTKHHIVPYQFRKLLPEEYKTRSSIDLVPLCESCHKKYENKAYSFKEEIFKFYGIRAIKHKRSDKEKLKRKILKKEHALSFDLREDIHLKIEKEIKNLKSEFKQNFGLEADDYQIKSVEYEDERASELINQLENYDLFCKNWINHFFENMELSYMCEKHKKYLLEKYSEKSDENKA